MKRLISWANLYISHADWKDLVLVKCCLCAVGILIGCALPKRMKKPTVFTALGIFIVAYIPLMIGFIKEIRNSQARKIHSV